MIILSLKQSSSLNCLLSVHAEKKGLVSMLCVWQDWQVASA